MTRLNAARRVYRGRVEDASAAGLVAALRERLGVDVTAHEEAVRRAEAEAARLRREAVAHAQKLSEAEVRSMPGRPRSHDPRIGQKGQARSLRARRDRTSSARRTRLCGGALAGSRKWQGVWHVRGVTHSVPM
jgi:hypothetical protein